MLARVLELTWQIVAGLLIPSGASRLPPLPCDERGAEAMLARHAWDGPHPMRRA